MRSAFVLISNILTQINYQARHSHMALNCTMLCRARKNIKYLYEPVSLRLPATAGETMILSHLTHSGKLTVEIQSVDPLNIQSTPDNSNMNYEEIKPNTI